jgi:alkaline phosphatase D
LEGVASGDPQPDSVVLWTRVVAKDGSMGPIDLRLQVSLSRDFKALVIDEALRATSASDFTVRVLTQGLDADRVYFYRFKAGSSLSRVGRTRTAPQDSADSAVRFAWVSCQSYASGFYGTYRQMLNDDAERPGAFPTRARPRSPAACSAPSRSAGGRT